MQKYCKNCGSELADESVFCDECGTRVGATASRGSTLFQNYNINIMGGESVIRQSQIHSGCLIPPAVLMGFGLMVGFAALINSIGHYYFNPILDIFNIFTVVGLIWLVIRLIAYYTNDLILTNKRVFGKCGLISTTQMQSPLNKIDSVSYSNGLIGKLIGYGTVRIATTSSVFKFRFIRDGQTFYNDIFNQLEASEVESRNKNAQAIVDAMAEKLS